MNVTINKYEWRAVVNLMNKIIIETLSRPDDPPKAGDCAFDILSELSIEREKDE